MNGILIDVSRCIACEKCISACVKRNDLDPRLADRDRAVKGDGLSSHRLSTIISVDQGRFARKSCMHCIEPSCVSACLVGGITKTAEGPVIYDPDKCIGCRYCMLACPFHIPRYQWDRVAPFMIKCDMCYDRIRENLLPACVEACPQDVLRFGDRESLLRLAHSRIDENPGRYLNHVWGEGEFGGTSVIYISDVDLTEIGWPNPEPIPIPHLTEPLIHTTPLIGMSVAVSLVGLNWIVKRRIKLADEKKNRIISDDISGGDKND